MNKKNFLKLYFIFITSLLMFFTSDARERSRGGGRIGARRPHIASRVTARPAVRRRSVQKFRPYQRRPYQRRHYKRAHTCHRCGIRLYAKPFWGWGIAIPLWWSEPIIVVEKPFYLDENAIDYRGYSYWKIFNTSKKPVIFKPFDGPSITIEPGQIIQAQRGKSFAFDIKTPDEILLRQDATDKHFIKIYDRGYGIDHTNSSTHWKQWKRNY